MAGAGELRHVMTSVILLEARSNPGERRPRHMSRLLDELKARGFVAQISNEAALAAALERGQVTLYCGYDPSNSSLTVGNLLTIMLLAHFQRFGHRPIVLMGGGTGMVGDPSGKTSQRRRLTLEEIQANL